MYIIQELGNYHKLESKAAKINVYSQEGRQYVSFLLKERECLKVFTDSGGYLYYYPCLTKTTRSAH